MTTESEAKAHQTVEDIVRPLAERTILCPECQGAGFIGEGTAYVACPRDIPDPRFEALRTGDYVDRLNHFRGIDASAGAILRAIQASGMALTLSFVKASPQHPFLLRDTWLAVWPRGGDNAGTGHDHAYADTPEEALARALTGVTDWCW